MEYNSLYWEDVEEGHELPTITYELSLLRLVALVRATGLYDYVHFDRDYAQSVGARDVFIATPHVAGLFSRLLTDWSGPEADLHVLTFTMNTQSCVNDILKISGRVGKKFINDQGEYLVDLIDLNMAHDKAACAASATATMALPSKKGGAVKKRRLISNGSKTFLNDNIPDFAKSMMGVVKEGPQEPKRPLTEDEIHLWCECIEDWNPLYWDKEYARKTRYGGLISPPAGMFFGADSSADVGIGYLKPGKAIPDAVKKGLTGLPLLKALRERMISGATPFSVPDYPEVAVVQARADYYSPLYPGDSLHSTQELLNCSQKKQTKLGEGHFLSWINSYFNQRDELVKTFTLSVFYYEPA